MEDKILDRLKEQLESGALDDFVEEMKIKEGLINKYVEKFHEMTAEQRSEFIRKTIEKYNSDAYRDREMRMGYYEPRTELWWLLYDYARKYGVDMPEDASNPFAHSYTLIDDDWLVFVMHGQGSVIDVRHFDENDEYYVDIESEDAVPIEAREEFYGLMLDLHDLTKRHLLRNDIKNVDYTFNLSFTDDVVACSAKMFKRKDDNSATPGEPRKPIAYAIEPIPNKQKTERQENS